MLRCHLQYVCGVRTTGEGSEELNGYAGCADTLDLEVRLDVDIGDGNGRKVSNTRTLSGG